MKNIIHWLNKNWFKLAMCLLALIFIFMALPKALQFYAQQKYIESQINRCGILVKEERKREEKIVEKESMFKYGANHGESPAYGYNSKYDYCIYYNTNYGEGGGNEYIKNLFTNENLEWLMVGPGWSTAEKDEEFDRAKGEYLNDLR